MQLSFTEENYLKCLYHFTAEIGCSSTNTKNISIELNVKPATVTSMMKKLKGKYLVDYEKYGKVSLTDSGKNTAVQLIRKHRLWEVFLVEKLQFSWDEVHEVAEQLEHIQSTKLIDHLDAFLGHPETDPHGDPIPNPQGNIKHLDRRNLTEAQEGELCELVSVDDSHSDLLLFLHEMEIHLHSKMVIRRKIAFDGSLLVQLEKGQEIMLSDKMASQLMIR
jgi:DtxR family Mn-dependent transcriptional regulator